MMVRDAWIFSGGGFRSVSTAIRSASLSVWPLASVVLARADDLGNQFAAFRIEQQDDAAVGFDVLEDQVHDHFHDLIDAKAAAQRGAELVENLEIGHRRRRRARGRPAPSNRRWMETVCMMELSMPGLDRRRGRHFRRWSG